MISKELRAELKEAWEKSTQGEWRVDERVRDGERIYHIVAGNEKLGDLPLGRMWGDNAVWLERGGEGENATFSVLAHNSMPSLLETIEELERERDKLVEVNNSVRVCSNHVNEIVTGGGCLVCDNEAAESRATQAEAERDTAKEICRNTVNALGGFAAPEVSVEFLSHLPNEAKLLRGERDRMKEEVERLQSENEMLRSQLDMRGCIRKLASAALKGDGK